MIADLLGIVLDWPAFLIVLAVWGFAPRAVLRIIVLAFADQDRRNELMAEICVIPRWERPLWVCEQIETAICEGIWDRLIDFGGGIFYDRWHLTPGDAPADDPDFESHWQEQLDAVRPGTLVKLVFSTKDWGEGMWVEVTEVRPNRFVGVLRNQPVGIPRLGWGKRVKFREAHIIRIEPAVDSITDAR